MFTGNTWFGDATFTDAARFDGATFPSTRWVDRTTSSPWTTFAGARFEGGVPPKVAQFASPSANEAESPAGD
ncbi:hypothetical protein [Alloactinosynnema sp. L-07]|nr:hypothetical protein [Alloactinosynnema sp. L-07]